MNHATRFTAALLAGFCIFGAAQSAQAHHVKYQRYVEAETTALIRTAIRSGITVFTERTDDTVKQFCNERRLYGQANNSNQLLICIGNHKGNQDELADTIRHELIHSAQFCKARRVGATMALLRPDLTERSMEIARELHMPMSKYEEKQWPYEAEARALAFTLDEHEVADLVASECGKD